MYRSEPKGYCPREVGYPKRRYELKKTPHDVTFDIDAGNYYIGDMDPEAAMAIMVDAQNGLPLSETWHDQHLEGPDVHCLACGHPCRTYADFERAVELGVVERNRRKDEREYGTGPSDDDDDDRRHYDDEDDDEPERRSFIRDRRDRDHDDNDRKGRRGSDDRRRGGNFIL